MKTLLLVSATLLLVACQQTIILHDDNAGDRMIRFGASINREEGKTRAPIEIGENGQLSRPLEGIQILRGADGASPSFDTIAVPTTTGKLSINGSTLTLAAPQLFNAVHDDAHFMAFYPAPTNFEAGKATFVIDGKQDIIVADPKTAQYAEGNEAMVDLYFKHQLVWVKLKIRRADENAAISFGDLLSSEITVPNEMELLIASDGTTTFRPAKDSDEITLDFGSAVLTGDIPDEDSNGGIILANSYLIYPPGDDFAITLRFANRPGETFQVNGLSGVPGTKSFIMVMLRGTQFQFSNVTVEDWSEIDDWDWDDETQGLVPV